MEHKQSENNPQLQSEQGNSEVFFQEDWCSHRGAEKTVPSWIQPKRLGRKMVGVSLKGTKDTTGVSIKARENDDPGLAPAVRRRTATCQNTAMNFFGVNILQNTALIFKQKAINTKIFVQIHEWKGVLQLWEPQHDDRVALLPGVQVVKYADMRSGCIFHQTFPTTHCHFGEKIYHCPAAFWSAHELISPLLRTGGILQYSYCKIPRVAEKATNWHSFTPKSSENAQRLLIPQKNNSSLPRCLYHASALQLCTAQFSHPISNKPLTVNGIYQISWIANG